jgi:hypothetical protein
MCHINGAGNIINQDLESQQQTKNKTYNKSSSKLTVHELGPCTVATDEQLAVTVYKVHYM